MDIATIPRDYTKHSRLHYVVEDSDIALIQSLLDEGTDINIKNIYDASPLFWAKRAEVMKYLLDHGADPNIAANEEEECVTPIFIAIQNNNLEAVKLLLSYGASVNVKNLNLETPLHQACTNINSSTNNYPEIVEILFKHGADIEAKTSGDYTPLHCASSHGALDIVKILLQHGANVNALTWKNELPLDLAKCYKYIDVVEFLIVI